MIPLITLTSDFGTKDAYVASMKAALLGQCPWARMIDVTHQVPPQDILCGSITLERAIDGFPPGTIHLAVVDPGVGTKRRLIVTELNSQIIVSPDNGLITWPWRRLGPGKSRELTWRPARTPSNTFHGRDIMAPVAGMLATGKQIETVTGDAVDPILLDIVPAQRARKIGAIIHIDHFGNATTNIDGDVLKKLKTKWIRVANLKLGKLKKTYWNVAPGKPLALIGSSGLLEIAVRDGSAAADLKLRVGDRVSLE